MNLKIYPLSTLKVLCTCIFILLISNLVAVGVQLNSENTDYKNFAHLFNFNGELNIPSVFSTLMLLACAVLLFYMYRTTKNKRSYRFRWLVLSLIFFFLAIDEFFSIHERLMFLLRDYYNLTGIFYYAWIIPYGIAVILLAILYVPFVFKLPHRIKILFLASAAIYISGAIGFEILGGQQEEIHGVANYRYALFYTLEELFEMVGTTIFIYALLSYIVDFMQSKKLEIPCRS